MSKSSGKLIAFVLAYFAVAYLFLIILGVIDGETIAGGPIALMALLVALVTVLFDEKGTVPAPQRLLVRGLLVPITIGWLYLCYQAISADSTRVVYIWHPLVVTALFVAPTLVNRRRKRRQGR